MDIQAVLNEYDGFYARNDPEGAYAFICGKIAEAREAGAWQHELTMLNEVIGYSRKHLMTEEGNAYIARADEIIAAHGMENDVAAATTWLNSATCQRAFGNPERSLAYFAKTEEVYRQKVEPFDYRYASLYNNMALVYSDIGDYARAEELSQKAVGILLTDPDSAAELAATYVSLAVNAAKRAKAAAVESMAADAEAGGTADGPAKAVFDYTAVPEVREYVSKATALLDPEGEYPDQYYAYMAMVNSNSLKQLGFAAEAQRLVTRAQDFYAKLRK
ncbi:MAG: tetratricopeptide repeat protein [Lachnospiraceae bacterium]|nr:tetratricopeptide repeat protein [Lachnospiraceae bacterium]